MTRMTPEAMALFEREARLRLESKTNKQLARLTGFAPKYVANLVAKLRRELAQRESELVDVSCGTTTGESIERSSGSDG